MTKSLFLSPSKALFALAAALVATGANNARAAIVLGDRNSSQTLSFSDTSAFSDAVGHGNTTYSISGSAGDSDLIGYTTSGGSTGFGVSTTAGFSVTSPVLTPGIPNETESFTLNALSTTTGTLTIMEQLAANAAPPGALGTLNTGVTSGFNVLLGNYNPSGNLIATGSSFTYTLYIPGNYSTSGIGSGEHELLNINSNWTITDNFGFNGTDTVFSATVNNYNSSTDRINLQYEILGAPAPVPIPATAWLMVSGLVGLGAMARKRKAAYSSSEIPTMRRIVFGLFAVLA